ncbi:MAG TPA: glycoside hydrolase family 3 N-terminal domain-containing protein, partial [Rubrobacter sp.]|nr:glycoside hydrolase family 3 N-terminal domain-containing protein [Rubrobacter sp.]
MAFEVLRLVITLALLVFVLAGCAGAPGNGSSDGGQERASTVVPEREEKEDVPDVAHMSVRDMVGQMFVVSMGGTAPDYYIEKMVRERNIGGVILFGYNMKSESQVKALTGSLQKLSMKTGPAVPLFVAVDQEGGDIASAPWVAPEPAAAEVGRRGDPDEARAIAARMGRQL